MLWVLYSVIAAAGIFYSLFSSDTSKFSPGACSRIESYLNDRIVGQKMAIDQLVDAVCTHIEHHKHGSQKPLIISVHGPVGVGKTYSHTLLAKALYNSDPDGAACPGLDCIGAKVIYGLDFVKEERDTQLGMVRSAILQHTRTVTDPLIVIEEYDKLDCASRAMLRQLFSNPEASNTTLGRAVILLESNLGMSELEQLQQKMSQLFFSKSGIGSVQVSAEAAEKALRNAVFSAWRHSGCDEAYSDTLKIISLIDFFLPFFPLERDSVRELMRREVKGWAAVLWHEKHTAMRWGQEVVEFLVSRVDFDGDFPLEGGKQARNVATRYLARLVRTCPLSLIPPSSLSKGAHVPSNPGLEEGPGGGLATQALIISVDEQQKGLKSQLISSSDHLNGTS
jgi:hypothetical protein